jgi:Secretion system C-terminal sorting domain
MKKNTPLLNFQNKPKTTFLVLVAAVFSGASAYAQTTRYVKPVAVGTADGSSWENASDDIQLMLNTSVSGDAVWVAGGTYKPTRKANDLTVITPNDRDNAFFVKDSVQLYGGFAGTEIELSERDLSITANASILSADFNGDDAFEYNGDTLNIVNNAENAYHVLVLTSTGTDATLYNNTRIDGFTITGGNANDSALTAIAINNYNVFRYCGGGIINHNPTAPSFANLTITGNYATYGGGVYNRYLAPATYTNVVITQNVAQFGGGVLNWNSASPMFENAIISNNRADAGGGVYNYNLSNPSFSNAEISNNFASLASGGGFFSNNSSPVLNETTISGNVAALDGGGMFNTTNANPVITNTVITQNQAQNGGGIYAYNSTPVLTDVEISENLASEGNGGGYYNFQSAPVLTNVSFNANNASGFGGGMANWTGANATLTGCEFIENTAANAGGVFNFDDSDAMFTNTLFSSNQTAGNGGGAYNRQDSDAVYTNCVFTGNSANYGGGMYSYDGTTPVLTNVTISANEALIQGGGITSDSSSQLVRNSIIYGNTGLDGGIDEVFNYNGANPVFTYSLVNGTEETWDLTGVDGGNNVYGDPLFTSSEEGDYSIQLLSPARDAGSNSYFDAEQTPDLSAITTDIAGNERFYLDGIVDIGAYEVQAIVGLPSISQLQVTAYPNPVVNMLNITAKDTVTGVTAYNMLGQEVSATWNSTNNTLNMAALQAGNYVVKVTVGKATGSVLVVKK